MSDEDETFARFALSRLPAVDRQVREAPAFREWLGSQVPVEVDGEQFYVVGGDMLADKDEMRLTWARDHAMIDGKVIARLEREHDKKRGT